MFDISEKSFSSQFDFDKMGDLFISELRSPIKRETFDPITGQSRNAIRDVPKTLQGSRFSFQELDVVHIRAFIDHRQHVPKTTQSRDTNDGQIRM
jgi:hypothetical protein